MGDFQTEYTTEQLPPEKGYSENRFYTILTTIVIFIFILAFKSHTVSIDKYGDSDAFLDILTGDLEIKSYYVFQKLNNINQSTDKESIELGEKQKKSAIINYRRAAYSNPAPFVLRKLIILESQKMRTDAINKLLSQSENLELDADERTNIKKEAALWSEIYLDPKQNPKKVGYYVNEINNLKLGSFAPIALADVYKLKGGEKYQSQYQIEKDKIFTKSIISLAGLLIGLGFFTIILLAGTIILIVYVILYFRNKRRLRQTQLQAADEMSPIDKSYMSGYLIEAFLVFLISEMAVSLLFSSLIFIMGMREIISSQILLVLSLISEIISAAITLFYLRNRLSLRNWSIKVIGLTKGKIPKNIGWGFAGYAASIPLMLFASSISKVVDTYIPTPPNSIAPKLLQSSDAFSRIIIFLLVSVLAPVLEEVFFRGILFTSFRKKWNVTTGLILSSVLFALLHPFPLSFLPIFVLGSVYTILTIECKSLIPNIIAHSLNNTIIFILMIIVSG